MRGLLIFGVLVLVAIVALVAALALVSSRNGNVLSALTRARVAATATPPAAAAPAATPTGTAPPAAPQTLLDASGSGSKLTQNFTVAGEWDLAWSFDCSRMGQSRGWSVTVEDGGGVPPRDSLHGAIELAETQQGTVHNQAPGTFHLNVATDPPCTWHLAVTGPPGPPPASPTGQAALDATGTGKRTTSDFTVAGAWDLAWSYDCTSAGHGRNFGISVEGVAGASATGDSVIQLGEQEAGLAHHEGTGTFHLIVDTDPLCSWHVTVTH
jgi:hypothetical protein